MSGSEYRRAVEKTILDLKRFAAGENRDPDGYGAYVIIGNLRPVTEQLAADPATVRALLSAVRDLMPARGPGQINIEKNLLQIMHCIAQDACTALERNGTAIEHRSRTERHHGQPHWMTLEALAEFATFCLKFRKTRDPFGGGRRVMAFVLLDQAGEFMDLPEAVNLAEELEKNNRNDGAAAMNFLMSYFEARDMSEQAMAPAGILQLRITLQGIDPPIWRRVLVPNEFSFGELHEVVNRVMGWDNSHPHVFKIGEIRYGHPELVEDCGFGGGRDEDTVLLAAVLKRKGQVLEYEYDFGDCWEHQIKVEKVLPWDPELRLPVCLAGERACPPEDCGGVYGYHRILEALRNPNDPELDDTREWVGEFDSEKFDLKK